MRKYKKIVEEKGSPFWWTGLKRGLKKVNIGEDVYLYGRQKYVANPDTLKYGPCKEILHMVIYGPGRKEYHVWGDDVLNFSDGLNRDGNKVREADVKIYILSSILDDRKNWVFDLTKIPENGHLKVIYENGTVKNIEFDGKFNRVHRHKYDDSGYLVWNSGNYHIDKNLADVSKRTYMIPIGYRKN